MPWYYAADRQQRGPVSDEEFAGLVQTGVVRAETLVWREGWPNWQPYAQAYAQAQGAASAAGVPAGAGGVGGVNGDASPFGAGAGAGGAPLDADSAVCAVSGRVRPKREMLEFEGRWVSAEHKEEFFQRLREGVSAPTEMRYAGFWVRFAAKIIDGIACYVIGVIPQMLLTMVFFGSFALNPPKPDYEAGELPGFMGKFLVFQALNTLLGLAIGISYYVFFIRRSDATPGKMALGLKVLRADGSKLSVGRIIGRYFAEFLSTLILFIGYIMAAFDKEERRALHDHICDTRVITTRR